MIRFLAGRLARLLAVLLLASALVFLAVYLAPGSPLSAISGGRSLTPKQVDTLNEEYDLNDPLPSRYGKWLAGAVQGDFGSSAVSHEPVGSLIGARMATTTILVVYAALLIVFFALALGALAALRGGWVDTSIVGFTGAMAAVPSFVAAAVLITVFSVNLGLFPVLGDGASLGIEQQIWHLTLPAFALALAGMGFCARVTRTSVLEERGREHVRVARLRGLPQRRVTRRHVLRNAAIPVTTAVGLTVASLIAGSVVVEQAFSLDGLGSLLIDAINDQDYPVIQGVTLLLVTVFVVVNTIVDMVQPLLDPRLELGVDDEF